MKRQLITALVTDIRYFCVITCFQIWSISSPKSTITPAFAIFLFDLNTLKLSKPVFKKRHYITLSFGFSNRF